MPSPQSQKSSVNPNVLPPQAGAIAFGAIAFGILIPLAEPLSATNIQPPNRPAERSVTKSMDEQLLDELGAETTNRMDDPSHDGRKGPEKGRARPADLSLDAKTAESTKDDRAIEAIGYQMREVEQLLKTRAVSSDALARQDMILADLDKIIDSLRKKCNQQQHATRTNEPGNTTNKPENGPTENGPAGSGEKAADTNAHNGTPGKETNPETANVQQALSEYWGHLPERLRAQIQSSAAVEFLPEYRELIEAYYRRLAEDRRDR